MVRAVKTHPPPEGSTAERSDFTFEIGRGSSVGCLPKPARCPSSASSARSPTGAGSGSNFYPILERLKFSALFDDAGNAYVSFILQTNGDTTQTYLVAFAPDGHKLWGFNLKTTYNGTCQATRVLSNHRLIVSCDGRYERRLLILGE